MWWNLSADQRVKVDESEKIDEKFGPYQRTKSDIEDKGDGDSNYCRCT